MGLQEFLGLTLWHSEELDDDPDLIPGQKSYYLYEGLDTLEMIEREVKETRKEI